MYSRFLDSKLTNLLNYCRFCDFDPFRGHFLVTLRPFAHFFSAGNKTVMRPICNMLVFIFFVVLCIFRDPGDGAVICAEEFQCQWLECASNDCVLRAFPYHGSQRWRFDRVYTGHCHILSGTPRLAELHPIVHCKALHLGALAGSPNVRFMVTCRSGKLS